MESKIEEALRAKATAEKHFMQKDLLGAKSYGIKAQMLCPELEGMSQMVATFGVYLAAEAKINGEPDFYSILGMDATATKSKLKKQYKKLAVLLHPDKNKTVGADGAFRLVCEAWTLLSDSVNRRSYDQRRNLFAWNNSLAGAYENCSKSSASRGRLDSFWTVCTSCHVQYEYLRKYVNKRLSCKNCRGVFIAVETGLAPVDVSLPYCTYPCVPEIGHGNQNSGVKYVPTTTGYCAPNGTSGHHTGYRSEHVSPNISFQGSSSGNSVGVFEHNGLSPASFAFHKSDGEAKKTKANGRDQKLKPTGHMPSNGYTVQNEELKPRRGRPSKKRKLDSGSTCVNGHEEASTQSAVEPKIANENERSKAASKLSSALETSSKRYSMDARQFLVDIARKEIRKKLEEMRIASEIEAADAEKRNALEAAKVSGPTGSRDQPEAKRTVPMSITVPDSDFHDFDQDRSEECFKPKQIWALYDEEDGMPRLYCLIRDVLSVRPFQIYISYLSSRSDSEFGSVNWLDSGFTKSCGSFRVFNSEMVDQVNIFSHLLRKEKAGRGGCVRIYPRRGDIWAVYRNWSPDWDRTTPSEVRHKYEMVEVLDDYSEELGVWVAPLIKLDPFKTVYQKTPDNESIRYIPRREMLRFSHQVPSCSLKVEGTDLPEGCWDLDPAAIPDELLPRESEVCNTSSVSRMEMPIQSTDEQQYQVKPEGLNQIENVVSIVVDEYQDAHKMCTEEQVLVGLAQTVAEQHHQIESKPN
ncbi:hypothetical protein F511_03585 [Dorcoceras hygrometricum]|uniref:J domain-containing protein n=1 Tax=Dorcoceras hygrometricum TaxID=472368 RepID=A0A2Z7D5A9_9LAMI|nr:hypothetical protein F511_03585 [Dorcoceras hygrometricum]